MGQRSSMKPWQTDKQFSDIYLTKIKRSLGEFLIHEASIEEDMLHNTDLIVLNIGAVRIGCRIRREKYYFDACYRKQFTVRCSRPSGNKTELEKIMEGWGDYLFYGFGGDDGELLGWSIIDLAVFREFVIFMRTRCNCEPGIQMPNSDGSSDFRAYSWDDIPRQFKSAKPLIAAQYLPALVPALEVIAW